MEPSVQEELKQNFLVCSLCQHLLHEPKTLPCLHNFCCPCLQYYLSNKQAPVEYGKQPVIACPICHKVCGVPRIGVEGFLDNHLVAMLIESFASAEQTSCDLCKDNEKTVAASHVCIKCEDFLCEDCAKNHKGTRLTRNHLVMSMHTMKSMHNLLKQKDTSQQKIHVKMLYRFGHHGENFFSPFAIAVSKSDDVYISCEDNKICVYSLDGQCKKIVHQNPFYGLPRNCLPNMCCAVTVEGYVAVAMRKDITDGYVYVAVIESLAGREVGLCKVKPTHLTKCKPCGITILSNNYLAVSDVGNHCIYIFNNELKSVRKFGKYGKKEKQFKYPYFLCTNSHNNVLISDYENHCVKEFTTGGKLVQIIGQAGHERGQFMHPMGLCTDKQDNVFVCDRDNHRLQMFNRDGRFLKLIVKSTCREGMDIRPQDIKVTQAGLLAVLLKGIEGMDLAEIQIYKYSTSGDEREVSRRQMFSVRDSLNSLQLNPNVPPTRANLLPPLGCTAALCRPSAEPSAPSMPPDVVPNNQTSNVRRDLLREKHTSDAVSKLCIIS